MSEFDLDQENLSHPFAATGMKKGGPRAAVLRVQVSNLLNGGQIGRDIFAACCQLERHL